MSLQYEEEPLAEHYGYGPPDSFPKDFGYGEEEEEEAEDLPAPADSKPRILLMGLRRSGKSSIQKVVFHKMSPNETLFLESTNKIYKDDISSSSFVNFQIWDFPGQVDFFDPTFDYEMIFRGTGALIFVIDAQDDYVEALGRLHLTVTRAYRVNPDINFEVFIHKVDGLSDDHKIETQRDIHQRANDDLVDASLEKLHLSFYLTSIYDHSIFEAFSKVVQKLIPQLPTLENLLNIFISVSRREPAQHPHLWRPSVLNNLVVTETIKESGGRGALISPLSSNGSVPLSSDGSVPLSSDGSGPLSSNVPCPLMVQSPCPLMKCYGMVALRGGERSWDAYVPVEISQRGGNLSTEPHANGGTSQQSLTPRGDLSTEPHANGGPLNEPHANRGTSQQSLTKLSESQRDSSPPGVGIQ
ncbi:unnamed protein product [Boreogadus saida]